MSSIAKKHRSKKSTKTKMSHNLEKEDMLEITADGKQEIVAGKEPLKKDPHELKERWKRLKKSLNNLRSIMDLSAALKPDKEKEPTDSDKVGIPTEDDTPSSESEGAPEKDQEVGDQDTDSVNSASEDQELDMEAPSEEEGDRFDQEAYEQELVEMLRHAGYSDPEIAYIVKGQHSPDVGLREEAIPESSNMGQDTGLSLESDESSSSSSSSDDSNDSAVKSYKDQIADLERQIKLKQMELEHKHAQRMKDLEYEAAKSSMLDPSEREHKRQLMALELEKERLELEKRRQEIALELEMKKRELELKLKQAEAAANRKASDRSLSKAEE